MKNRIPLYILLYGLLIASMIVLPRLLSVKPAHKTVDFGYVSKIIDSLQMDSNMRLEKVRFNLQDYPKERPSIQSNIDKISILLKIEEDL